MAESTVARHVTALPTRIEHDYPSQSSDLHNRPRTRDDLKSEVAQFIERIDGWKGRESSHIVPAYVRTCMNFSTQVEAASS